MSSAAVMICASGINITASAPNRYLTGFPLELPRQLSPNKLHVLIMIQCKNYELLRNTCSIQSLAYIQFADSQQLSGEHRLTCILNVIKEINVANLQSFNGIIFY